MRKGTVYKALAGMMVPALLVTLICAAPALASEGGHDAPRWGDFGWRCLNLVIFVAILWHFVGKMTVNFFRNRKKNIEEGIDNLQARREAAEAHLAEIETGQTNANVETLWRIAEALGIKLSDLMRLVEKAIESVNPQSHQG